MRVHLAELTDTSKIQDSRFKIQGIHLAELTDTSFQRIQFLSSGTGFCSYTVFLPAVIGAKHLTKFVSHRRWELIPTLLQLALGFRL